MKSEDTHREERRSQEVSSCLIQTSCGCSGGDSLPHVLCVCTDIELVHHTERMQSHTLTHTQSHTEVQQLENTHKKNPRVISSSHENLSALLQFEMLSFIMFAFLSALALKHNELRC